jgi:hypothetical protein
MLFFVFHPAGEERIHRDTTDFTHQAKELTKRNSMKRTDVPEQCPVWKAVHGKANKH